MSKESDLNAKADDVRPFVDQETPDAAEWNENPTVLEDSLRLIGGFFTDTDGTLADLIDKFEAEHNASTGAHSAPSEWVRLSGANSTPLFLDSTHFELVGNWTNSFAIADRVRAQLATNVFVIAAVKTVTFAASPNRTTVTLDAPVLTSALQTVDTGLTRHSQPKIEPNDLVPTVLASGVRGLSIEVSSATPTQAIVKWLEAIVQGVRVQAAPGTLPIGTAGGTGNSRLDTGTWVAATAYAVHLLTNDFGTAAATVASLSTTAPVLPLGYTKFLHVGWIYTKGGSTTDFVPMYQEGSCVDVYEFLALDKLTTLAEGETDYVVDLSTVVPPGTRVVYVDVYFATQTMSVAGARAVWTEPGNARGAVPFPIRQLCAALAVSNAVVVSPKLRQVLDANRRFVTYITVPPTSTVDYGLAVTLRGWEHRGSA